MDPLRWPGDLPCDDRVIEEILRPEPRFDARVLGILEDETLPSLEAALAEHLAAAISFDTSTKVASLIERYATRTIEPQVLVFLNQRIAKESCATQNSLLAYLLRVDPAIARTKIETALSSNEPVSYPCGRTLFRDVPPLHNDPLLQELAIKSLESADPQIAFRLRTPEQDWRNSRRARSSLGVDRERTTKSAISWNCRLLLLSAASRFNDA